MKGCLIIHSNIPIDSNWEQLTRAHFAKRKHSGLRRKQEIFEKVWSQLSNSSCSTEVKEFEEINTKHSVGFSIFILRENLFVKYWKCCRSSRNCSERIGLKSTYALASDDKNENKYCFWHNKWGFDISNNLVNTSSWTKLFLSAKAKKNCKYICMKLSEKRSLFRTFWKVHIHR